MLGVHRKYRTLVAERDETYGQCNLNWVLKAILEP